MKKRKVHSSKAAADSKQRNGQESGQQQQQQQQQQQKAAGGKVGKTIPGSDKGCESDDENEGFGNWLRSSDGVAYMRLFVVANSLLVFMTMSWSHVWQVVDIVRDVIGL